VELEKKAKQEEHGHKLERCEEGSPALLFLKTGDEKGQADE
jgi:hypothetical protein